MSSSRRSGVDGEGGRGLTNEDVLGEALFVMARDWLDTTQSRPVPKSAEAEALESSLTAEALAALEKEEAGHGCVVGFRYVH